jgi:hypothetical protein
MPQDQKVYLILQNIPENSIIQEDYKWYENKFMIE